MSFFCKSLINKIFAAGFHHSGVLSVNIADKKPCTYAVVSKGGTKFRQSVLVIREQFLCLSRTVALCTLHAHFVNMRVTVVRGGNAVVLRRDFHSLGKIKPESNFAAVQRRLLNQRDLGRVRILNPRFLIGAVAYKITLKNDFRA